jgi:hypothetical protein
LPHIYAAPLDAEVRAGYWTRGKRPVGVLRDRNYAGFWIWTS